jgi:hypothetical protein
MTALHRTARIAIERLDIDLAAIVSNDETGLLGTEIGIVGVYRLLQTLDARALTIAHARRLPMR